MRKALLPAFLLMVVAVILGATVFREQLVHAATTPFQQVVVMNPTTNPVPVAQVGTSTTSVSGTVGIDPGKNTVKLEASGNTVSLDSTDSTNLAGVATHLANIDAATGAAPIKDVCGAHAHLGHDDSSTLCSTSGSWDISTIVATGMDDNLIVDFTLDNRPVFSLFGGDEDGTSVYQLDLPKPLRADAVSASCGNLVEDCAFTLQALGTAH